MVRPSPREDRLEKGKKAAELGEICVPSSAANGQRKSEVHSIPLAVWVPGDTLYEAVVPKRLSLSSLTDSLHERRARSSTNLSLI